MFKTSDSEYTPLLDAPAKLEKSPSQQWSFRAKLICGGALFLFSLIAVMHYISNPTTHSRLVTAKDSTSTIRVGYIEHVVQWAQCTSVAEARVSMNENLDLMEPFIVQAAAEGVTLLLLPEFGMTGLINYIWPEEDGYTHAQWREYMYYYLEEIPEPLLGDDSTACRNPAFADRPILTRLSCLAADNGLHLSVNWGTYEDCETTDSSCPSDGRYQYNTQVVFDPLGQIVAKYYKMHLFSEYEYDTPATDDPTYFNMPYGNAGDTVKVGLMTCFDSIYATPSWSLMKDADVNFFLLSHWWVVAPTTASATQWMLSVSETYGINFVVAASSWFKGSVGPSGSSGSGVFSQGEALEVYYNINNYPVSHLGYADLPIDIDGPYIDEDPPAIQEAESGFEAGFKTCYGTLNSSLGAYYNGWAYAGSTLTGHIECDDLDYTCDATLEVSDDSDDETIYYWYMVGKGGYYAPSDNAGNYLYEQTCYLMKCNYTEFVANTFAETWDTTTIFSSFEMTADFNENATVFAGIVGEYGLPFDEETTLEVVDGDMTWTGTDLTDLIAGVNVQARVFREDVSSST